MSEMSKPQKMSFWESLTLIRRGYGVIHRIEPMFLPVLAGGAFIDAVAPLFTVAMSARILNELAGARDIQVLMREVAIAVVVAFVLAVLRVALRRKESALRATYQIKYFLFLAERYMELDYEHVENAKVNESLADIVAKTIGNSTGILILSNQASKIMLSFAATLVAILLLSGMFTTTSAPGSGFIASPWATALLGLLILLSMLFAFYQTRIIQHAQRKVYEVNPKTNTLFDYYQNYIMPGEAGKDIRIYAQQEALRNIFSQRLNVTFWHWYFHIFARSGGLSEAANAVVGGCVTLFIGLRALAGMYSVGNVVQYIGAVTSLVNSISQLIQQCGNSLNNAAYLPQVFAYLDLPDAKHKGSLTTEKRVDGDYEIEFHNVSFIYPGAKNYALKNLSLKFHIGQRLAVVGENGSGKTTMIKLLCRFYDPSEGYISLNGIDIRKYDYDEYMAIFAVVFQDFRLFGTALGQNVASSIRYDAARVEESLTLSGFGSRLERMSKGLETPLLKELDKNGENVSGGEAQKIAMARALYKDAPFIVLDEPTAALDPIAEYDIYSRINEIVGGKTAIYISHRLASCRFCDDIAVFASGKLVQRGSHDHLLEDATGKYYELWNAQARHYIAQEEQQKEQQQ